MWRTLWVPCNFLDRKDLFISFFLQLEDIEKKLLGRSYHKSSNGDSGSVVINNRSSRASDKLQEASFTSGKRQQCECALSVHITLVFFRNCSILYFCIDACHSNLSPGPPILTSPPSPLLFQFWHPPSSFNFDIPLLFQFWYLLLPAPNGILSSLAYVMSSIWFIWRSHFLIFYFLFCVQYFLIILFSIYLLEIAICSSWGWWRYTIGATWT